MRRIRESLRLWEGEDPQIPERILMHIQTSVSNVAELEQKGIQGELFQAGYLLTILYLYAMAGNAMEEPMLSVLAEERYSLLSLWHSSQQAEQNRQPAVQVLTSHCGMIQDNPLPRRRFFGREEELYDLLEMVIQGRKCLLSGIGGIGKTELLRQLLQLCQGERVADKIAVIPYEAGLAADFARAFPDIQATKPEECFHRVCAQIRRETEAGAKLLILVDDLKKGVDEDPELAQLQDLPCGILIASRRTALEGFETYPLQAPSVTTGTLIFRDNYGRPLSGEDRKLLQQLLQDGDMCHPLTLNLMARAARNRNWSVAQLQSHLQREGKDMTWVEEDRVVKTSRIYNQLYSLMLVPEGAKMIAELFTLLPSDSYDTAFLTEVFPDILGEEPEQKLTQLTDGGWLERSGSGYSMHPLIAESLRRKVITEDRLQTVLRCLHRQMPEIRLFMDELPEAEESHWQTGRILLYITGLMSGGISRGLMLDILRGASTQRLTQAAREVLAQNMTQWYKRCRNKDDLVNLLYCAVMCSWNQGDEALCRAVFEKQKAQLTVPENLYFDFCIYAGMDMIYKQRSQLAEELLKQVLDAQASPTQKAMAYYNLAGCSHILGSSEEAMRWSEQGVRYVQEHPECSKVSRFNNLHMLCNMYLKYRKQEPAQQLIRQMGELIEGNARPDLNAQYLNALGLYEVGFGDPDKALAYMQREQKFYEEYFGKDRDYYLQMNMIAHALALQQRYEESVDTYLTVIDYARKTEDKRLLQTTSNNISVSYMKNGEPEKALAHLQTAVSEGYAIGGLMLGEALRNSAICYGMLKDTEKELAFYRQAVPLLLEAYGADHPRAAAARQRLEELERESS